MATASPTRSPADPDTLVVPLKPQLPEGWYLVYWRAISVDGHPVQGAFTFAVGPNPGPAPQFVIPHIAQIGDDDAAPVARWAMFLTVMSSVGLLVDAARDRAAGGAPRRRDAACVRSPSRSRSPRPSASLAIPVYLEEATAIDSLRSFFAVGALVPLWRTTAFGRGYVDLWICFALFCLAAWIALWVDRPEPRAPLDRRAPRRRSAPSRRPRPCSSSPAPPATRRRPRRAGSRVALDWLHLSLRLALARRARRAARRSGRACRPGSRIAVLSVVVPRFSNVAFVSVARPARLGGLGGDPAPAAPLGALDDLLRPGDPGQGRPARDGDARSPRSTSLRTKPRLVAARGRPELGAAGGRAPARARLGRGACS